MIKRCLLAFSRDAERVVYIYTITELADEEWNVYICIYV